MMKSVARYSAYVVFVALLCFAPCAFGQGTVNAKATSAGTSVLNYTPSFFAFTFAPGGRGGDHSRGGNGGGNGNGNGCSNQGSGGGGWWGGNGGGNNGGGGCVAVPEGGTTLMYLLLAGLACFGAVALRSRRQVEVR
jgi:hypothetical protein